ncbi:LamG domain-containing protein [Variovorax sp. PAMC 28711]|uniref:LamG domain-containing protein n=1 Tax=Variovorax sp. PAMC 28711 TaxID=1795631 RepID=UPI00078CED3C|nr:LamG domain-containing protein [Variovorax sp. PAMC 28711]AMM22998.1 hypothetical protein AX767_00335 [Variovorax sp. PAMC 28711]
MPMSFPVAAALAPGVMFVARLRKGLAPLVAASSTPYRDAVMTDAPAAYFRLDEAAGNFVNTIVPAETGVASGTVTRSVATLTQDVGDKAITLSGSGNVDVSTTAYKYSSSFSYEAIVRITPGSLTSGNNLAVISKAAGGAYLRIKGTGTGTGVLNWLRSNIADLGSSSVTVSENTTYHVVVTVSAAGVPTFYVNGVAAGTGTTNTTFTESNNSLRIGQDNFSEYLQGTIDEVAIYNSTLSAARVLAHAQAAGLA